MPWLTVEDAANRLNQPRSELERRIACGEARTKKHRGQMLTFVADQDGQAEGSLEIDADRIAKAVERIVVAAQQLENVADAQTQKWQFDAGVAATLEGAIAHLQSVGKRSERAARAEARRAQLGERRARRLLRRFGVAALAALAVLAGWTAWREGRYRRTVQSFYVDRAGWVAALDGHQARMDQGYADLQAIIDAQCLQASDSAAAAADLAARIEAVTAQWDEESQRLVCEIAEARAEYETLRQTMRNPGLSLESAREDGTLQDVLDETWGITASSPAQVVGPSSQSADGLARRMD